LYDNQLRRLFVYELLVVQASRQAAAHMLSGILCLFHSVTQLNMQPQATRGAPAHTAARRAVAALSHLSHALTVTLSSRNCKGFAGGFFGFALLRSDGDVGLSLRGAFSSALSLLERLNIFPTDMGQLTA
jgi:hypothetical protein